MKQVLKGIVLVLLLGFILMQGLVIYQDVHRVLAYKPLVQEVLLKNQIALDENMVLAIIYTETKGLKADVMQSSESRTGVSHSITDARESIHQGSTVLAAAFKEAREKGTDDWTAIQAYNFGHSYIDYIAAHGGTHQLDLARDYSRDVVAPSLGNTTQATYFYLNPVSLFYGDPNLYHNGGNHYYAKQVAFRWFILQVAKNLSLS